MAASSFVGCMSRYVVSRHTANAATVQAALCPRRLQVLRAPVVWQVQTPSRQNGSRQHKYFGTQASADSATMVDQVKAKNASTPVIVYSKTYCPYCAEVKSLFKNLKVEHTVVELDSLADGDAVQNALRSVTSKSTVPQVFIANNFVGGCDDTMAAYKSGKLKALFEEGGIPAEI